MVKINLTNFFKVIIIYFLIGVPLILGVIIYQNINCINAGISNYLPDALWSCSLSLAILKLWSWRLNVYNIGVIIFTPILFELLQYINVFKGTGDILDVVVYLLSIFVTILFVSVFKKLRKENNMVLALFRIIQR